MSNTFVLVLNVVECDDCCSFVRSRFSSLLSCLSSGCCVEMSDLIVDTEYGRVRGLRKVSALNTSYNAFLGIRYATPPVGNLRFKVSKMIFIDNITH